MDDFFKKFGFTDNDPTETFVCRNCGALIELPIYCNVGRYGPVPVWCWKCCAEFKYWRNFGCSTILETEGWQPYKGKTILEMIWVPKKVKKRT